MFSVYHGHTSSRANALLRSNHAASQTALSIAWDICYFTAIDVTVFLPYIQFVPESARFYVVNGRPDKAEDVIKRIAWFNCRDPPKVSSHTLEVFVILHTLQWSTICYATGNVQKNICMSLNEKAFIEYACRLQDVPFYTLLMSGGRLIMTC